MKSTPNEVQSVSFFRDNGEQGRLAYRARDGMIEKQRDGVVWSAPSEAEMKEDARHIPLLNLLMRNGINPPAVEPYIPPHLR